jgi:hypothetical protein
MNPASPELQQLMQLVRRVDDRQQLAELLSRYGMAVDDRDFDAIGRQFAIDGEFHGVKGRQQIVDFYRARTSTFSTSSHYALTWHFDFTDDDHASGVVNAHAELCIGWQDRAPGAALPGPLRAQPAGLGVPAACAEVPLRVAVRRGGRRTGRPAACTLARHRAAACRSARQAANLHRQPACADCGGAAAQGLNPHPAQTATKETPCPACDP